MRHLTLPAAMAAFAGLASGLNAQTDAELSKQRAMMNPVEIADAIEDEILFDHAVDLHDITVTVRDGIATLNGTVDNILAKDRAAKIAETVRGVRSVINRITVEPRLDRSDRQIEQDVQIALLENPATESYQVDARVDGGFVTLTGAVESYREKELATRVAKGVRGVLGVEDAITWTTSMGRADAEMQADIAESLRWNTLIDGQDIDVSVENGVATLSGTVGSAAEKRRVILEAWVEGVSDVRADDLSVEAWAKDERQRETRFTAKSDEAIRDAVKDALLYDPRVVSFNVTTTVDNGTVTLRGEVANLEAKRAAESDARLTTGVLAVNNRLRVRNLPDLTDEQIADDIRAAIVRDPYIDLSEITVRVTNKAVELDGAVDSYFEKIRAQTLASRIAGVTHVENDVVVADVHDPYIYDPYLDDWLPDTIYISYDPPLTLKSDAEIAKDIHSQMFWSPFVGADEVNVTVDDGVATLTGTVDSLSEWYAARENAFEGGATWVVNKLDIEN